MPDTADHAGRDLPGRPFYPAPYGYSNAAIGLSGLADGRGARGRPGRELGPKPTERPVTRAVSAVLLTGSLTAAEVSPSLAREYRRLL